jgi:hypothetical protein
MSKPSDRNLKFYVKYQNSMVRAGKARKAVTLKQIKREYAGLSHVKKGDFNRRINKLREAVNNAS